MGWVDTNGDGIREDGAGNEITFSPITNTGNTVRGRVGAIIHQSLMDIDLGVEYRLVEFEDLVTQLVRDL